MQLSEEPFVILFFLWLFGWPPLPCLLVYLLVFFFLGSRVLKRDESILRFSAWERFRQQTFTALPFHGSWEELSYFYDGGEEARRRRKTSSLLETGKMVKARMALFFTVVPNPINVDLCPKDIRSSMYAVTVHIGKICDYKFTSVLSTWQEERGAFMGKFCKGREGNGWWSSFKI